MRTRQVSAFADGDLDYMKLMLARDLERLYTSVLEEPVPPELRYFIDCLERALEQPRAATET
jgi:hypothetical protein